MVGVVWNRIVNVSDVLSVHTSQGLTKRSRRAEEWMEFPERAVWPSGEEEKKEKTLVSSSKALTRFSSL